MCQARAWPRVEDEVASRRTRAEAADDGAAIATNATEVEPIDGALYRFAVRLVYERSAGLIRPAERAMRQRCLLELATADGRSSGGPH